MNLAAIVQSGFSAIPDGVKGTVTFTKEVAGAFDESTGQLSVPSEETVVCDAVQDKAQPRRYADLGLTESEAITLFCVPRTTGQRPPLGARCVWGGLIWTVRDSDPVAPAGSSIGESVVVAR